MYGTFMAMYHKVGRWRNSTIRAGVMGVDAQSRRLTAGRCIATSARFAANMVTTGHFPVPSTTWEGGATCITVGC